MAVIEADTPDIERCLRRLLILVKQAGGWVHPQARIRARGGNLSIIADDRLPPDRKFLQVPMHALLHVEKLVVKIKGGWFTYEPMDGVPVLRIQRELIEAMLELYNQTGKIGWFKESRFMLRAAAYPEVLDRVLHGRYVSEGLKQDRDRVIGGLEGRPLDDFICSAFIKSRAVRYKADGAQREDAFLMPIIDFLNHHHEGSRIYFSNRENNPKKAPDSLSILARQPLANSRECFAWYGSLDALDCYLSYHFINERAPYVGSIPMEFELEDVGKVVVKGIVHYTINNSKPHPSLADIQHFIPVLIGKPAGDTRTVSRLLIPCGAAPNALRRVLSLLVSDMTANRMDAGSVRERVRRAEELILSRNADYYRSLRKLVDRVIQEKGPAPVLEEVRQLADLQIIKLHNYGADATPALDH